MDENLPRNGSFVDRRKVFVEFRKNNLIQHFTASITSCLSIGIEKMDKHMKKEEQK